MWPDVVRWLFHECFCLHPRPMYPSDERTAPRKPCELRRDHGVVRALPELVRGWLRETHSCTSRRTRRGTHPGAQTPCVRGWDAPPPRSSERLVGDQQKRVGEKINLVTANKRAEPGTEGALGWRTAADGPGKVQPGLE